MERFFIGRVGKGEKSPFYNQNKKGERYENDKTAGEGIGN